MSSSCCHCWMILTVDSNWEYGFHKVVCRNQVIIMWYHCTEVACTYRTPLSQMQIHKYKYTNTSTQIQIHKYKKNVHWSSLYQHAPPPHSACCRPSQGLWPKPGTPAQHILHSGYFIVNSVHSAKYSVHHAPHYCAVGMEVLCAWVRCGVWLTGMDERPGAARTSPYIHALKPTIMHIEIDIPQVLCQSWYLYTLISIQAVIQFWTLTKIKYEGISNIWLLCISR